LVFDAVGRAYRPDVVVLAMYLGNDLKDNSLELALMGQSGLKAKARPFLDARVSEPGWRVTQVDYEGATRRYQKQMRLQAEPLYRLLRNSALLQLGQRALGRIQPIWWKGSGSKEGVSGDKVPPLLEFGEYYCSQPPEYDR